MATEEEDVYIRIEYLFETEINKNQKYVFSTEVNNTCILIEYMLNIFLDTSSNCGIQS